MPTGNLATVTRTPAGIVVTGDATDPDASGPVQVDVEVDGVVVGSMQASRADGRFAGTVPARAGGQVCAWALNAGQGGDALLGCHSLDIRVDPVGHIDEVAVTDAGLRVRGWVLDLDTTGPVQVRLMVDGTERGLAVANENRSDVGAAYPGYGGLHGFDITLAGPQRHTSVCAVGVNVGPGSSETRLGCARDPRAVSVLTLNIEGTQEEFANPVAYGTTVVPWRDRYRRLAGWMVDTSTLPDFIALQELPARKWWTVGWSLDPLDHVSPYDYESLFVLLDEIRARTGARYRIAYLSADRTGEPGLYQGKALIYNADRIRNTTTLVNGTPVAHDDRTTVGVHMRLSHPCHIVPPQSSGKCDLIDSTAGSDHEGRHLVTDYTDPTAGTWHRGPAAAAVFELRDDPGKHVIVANVHVGHRCTMDHKTPPCLALERAELLAVRNLVDAVSTAWAPRTKLVPPIVVGDFNGEADMPTTALDGSYAPTLPDFDRAAADDVDFVLVGKPGTYAAAHKVTAESVAYPQRVKFLGMDKAPYCGTPATTLADHCAVFVQLLPYTSADTPPPPGPATPGPEQPDGPGGPTDQVCERKPWLPDC
jgi:hypothetical protein